MDEVLLQKACAFWKEYFLLLETDKSIQWFRNQITISYFFKHVSGILQHPDFLPFPYLRDCFAETLRLVYFHAMKSHSMKYITFLWSLVFYGTSESVPKCIFCCPQTSWWLSFLFFFLFDKITSWFKPVPGSKCSILFCSLDFFFRYYQCC